LKETPKIISLNFDQELLPIENDEKTSRAVQSRKELQVSTKRNFNMFKLQSKESHDDSFRMSAIQF